MSRHLVSIVVPLYNEAANIRPFYDELVRVTERLDYDIESIFVDDGSSDDSAQRIHDLPGGNISIKLVRLSRNFGKEAATTAGLKRAKGDAIIIIDADLQHPIDKIPDFLRAWERGADVVVGVRQISGDERWLKRIGSRLFYTCINAVSATKIIPNETDYRLLTREVVDQYNELTEHNRITRGLIDWLGYDRAIVRFNAKQRERGAPKYSYRKLTRLAINTFVSYSFFPLRFAGYLGVIITFFSGLLGLFVLIEDVLLHDPLSLDITGTGMLALVILFMVGVILLCLGLFGLYIASIHDEVANRPLYIVRKNNKVYHNSDKK